MDRPLIGSTCKITDQERLNRFDVVFTGNYVLLYRTLGSPLPLQRISTTKIKTVLIDAKLTPYIESI